VTLLYATRHAPETSFNRSPAPVQNPMLTRCVTIFAAISLLAGNLLAQPNRIGRIDNSRRAVLRGQMHPNARAEFDRGAVDSSMVLRSLTIVLKPAAAQQADLEQLLAEQQDPPSPNYHRWLTP